MAAAKCRLEGLFLVQPENRSCIRFRSNVLTFIVDATDKMNIGTRTLILS